MQEFLSKKFCRESYHDMPFSSIPPASNPRAAIPVCPGGMDEVVPLLGVLEVVLRMVLEEEAALEAE